MLKLLKRYIGQQPDTQEVDLFNHPPALRKNALNIKVIDEVYFQVYWKVREIGKGPAVILYIFGKEVLKFDCFGKEGGHFHVNFHKFEKTSEDRIFLPEKNALEQIDRTIYELNTNLYYYLQRNNDPNIRKINIKKKNLENALVIIRSKMVEFLQDIPELSGI